MPIDKGVAWEMEQMRKRIEEEKERKKWERIMYVREWVRKNGNTPEYKAKRKFKRQAQQIEIDLLKEENDELRNQVQTLRYMIENAQHDIDKMERQLMKS